MRDIEQQAVPDPRWLPIADAPMAIAASSFDSLTSDMAALGIQVGLTEDGRKMTLKIPGASQPAVDRPASLEKLLHEYVRRNSGYYDPEYEPALFVIGARVFGRHRRPFISRRSSPSSDRRPAPRHSR